MPPILIDFPPEGGARVVDARGDVWLLDVKQTNDLFAHLPATQPNDHDADAGGAMLAGTVMTETI